MITRTARRLLSSLLVLLLASLVAFVILNAAPGDAAQAMIGESASAEQLQALREQLGLDQPLHIRYLRYLSSAVRGDLGESLVSGRPVTAVIGERFVHTLVLACVATLLAACMGILIGTAAATRRGSWLDLTLMGLASVGLAAPSFGLAMLLTLVFSLKLRLFPVAGGGTPAHLVLPAITLALPLLAVVARITRASLLDAADADYVLTAHGKGQRPRKIWNRHILRNALIPVTTMIGLHFGHLLGGAFVVETIFGWPGLGRMLVQAVFDQDYPVILGAVLLIALLFQLFNLLIDLAHGLLDPRVGSEAV